MTTKRRHPAFLAERERKLVPMHQCGEQYVYYYAKCEHTSLSGDLECQASKCGWTQVAVDTEMQLISIYGSCQGLGVLSRDVHNKPAGTLCAFTHYSDYLGFART